MSAELLTSDASIVQAQEQTDVVKQEAAPRESSIPLSTPPTSPLPPASFRLNKTMASGDDASNMRPPSTKRKHSRDGTKIEPESSQIVTGEVAQRAGQGKNFDTDTNVSSTMMPPSQTRSRTQQSKANAVAMSTASQKAPPSNQGAARPRKSQSKSSKSSKGSKAAAKKQTQEDSSDVEDDDEDDEGDDDDSQHGSENSNLSDEALPEKALPPFDWAGLEQRHRNKMAEVEAKEQQVLEEFNHMIGFFGIWADVGSGQEVDRSSKRLKTQRTYVQHEENELENKRQHYKRVVAAFTSALALLQN